MSEVKSIKQLVNDLDGLRERDIPYIARIALNDLAFNTKEMIDKDIAKSLHINKKKLTTSVRVKKATKSNPYAKVYIDEWAWQHKTLKHHFFGGDRDRKGLEKSLIAHGHMTKNEILTPPPGVTIRPSTYVKIIAQLKVVYKSGYSANETKKSRFRASSRRSERYFVIPSWSRSHLHPGIYARMPDANKPISILRIVKRPNYKKRLKSFESQVNYLQEKNMQRFINRAVDKVLMQNRSKGWA